LLQLDVRMNADVPTVGDYMTPGAYVVAVHDKVSQAKRIMQEHGIRHLPVMKDDGTVAGIVSDRDLSQAQALHPNGLTVEDAMTPRPYTVAPNAMLNVVARAMVKRRCGSAVVVDRNAVVGILTTIDAMQALADVLEGKASRQTTEGIGARPPAATRRAKLSAGEVRGRAASRAW
jgi:acetoin utilization protein AcuB